MTTNVYWQDGMGNWRPFDDNWNKPTGWKCPVCGRGVSPLVTVCPCNGTWYTPYYGTYTEVTEENDDGV